MSRCKDDQTRCYHCGEKGALHFCYEWDCFIHAVCALHWLADTQEGRIVLKHGHMVRLDFKLEGQYGTPIADTR